MDKHTRRAFLKTAVWGMGAAAFAGYSQFSMSPLPTSAAYGQPVTSNRPPNIVIVLADDMGYGDVQSLDPEFSKVPTPNIDKLAREGMTFTDAHSPSSVCSPTRYGLLTGRYPWRTRLQHGVLVPWDPPLIDAERLTLPAMLKQQGYHTAAIGKWHLGMNWPRQGEELAHDQPIADGPTTRGFDYFFGVDAPNYPPYTFIENDRLTQAPTGTFDARGKDQELGKKLSVRNPGPMVPDWPFEQVLSRLTDKAVNYIDQRAKEQQPFFLYFALTTPHEPYAPSPQFEGKSGIHVVGDLIMETDWALGQVMEALQRNGVADNTLLIFTTDNGHASYGGVRAFARAGHRVSGPYRGYKTSIWEGGHRVPFIARWPGRVQPGSTCAQSICLTDLMATCAEITGATLPANAGEDSFSILPLLTGRTDKPVRDNLILHSLKGEFALRQGPWVLSLCPDANGEAAGAPKAPGHLHNLDTDPGQKNNLWNQEPERVAAMTAALEQIVSNGRSNPGPQQSNDVNIKVWKGRTP